MERRKTRTLVNRLMAISLAAAMLVVVGCSDDDNNPMIDSSAPTMNIVETAAADGRFTTLLAAAEAADLPATHQWLLSDTPKLQNHVLDSRTPCPD